MGVKLNRHLARGSLTRIEDSLSVIEHTLDELQHEVSGLQSRWSGEARDAFSIAMRDAHASLRNLRAIASAATMSANTIIGDFEQFDRRRQHAWPV